jgi:hypothetical protein
MKYLFFFLFLILPLGATNDYVPITSSTPVSLTPNYNNRIPYMTRGILTLAPLNLTSPDFAPTTWLPAKFSLEGGNKAPVLEWRGVGKTVQEFAIILDDPDAPGGTFVHWVVYKIPGSTNALRTALHRARSIDDGTTQGTNSFGNIGYDGPKPPKGDPPHNYVWTLYALDKPLTINAGATKKELLTAIHEQSNIVQMSQLIGLFKSS